MAQKKRKHKKKPAGKKAPAVTSKAQPKESSPVQKLELEQKVIIEQKKDRFALIKRIVSLTITLILLVVVIWIGITIKNGLDNTMKIVTDDTETLCGDPEACIVIDAYYKDEFAEWNIREYWLFFGISIQTLENFEEDQEVQIICPVELKDDSFQHIFTKLNFLYKKNSIKDCEIVSR